MQQQQGRSRAVDLIGNTDSVTGRCKHGPHGTAPVCAPKWPLSSAPEYRHNAAQRWASAAAESGSAADAGGSQLHAVVGLPGFGSVRSCRSLAIVPAYSKRGQLRMMRGYIT